MPQLLSASWRSAHLKPAHSKAVRKAFEGNGNAQFHPWKGWRFSGVGITNHLRGLKCAIDAVVPAADALATASVFLPSRSCSGNASSLLKPPSSSQGLLQPHVDGSGNSLRVIHGWTSQCETGQDWASKRGFQSLAHIRGAEHQGTGGHTVGLRGLSVIRYHVLLTMIAPEWKHPAAPEFDFD